LCGEIGVYLEINSFSQRIFEIFGNRKKLDAVVKIEFEVTNL